MKYFITKTITLLLLSYLVFFVPIMFGWKPLVIVSASMKPVYHVGGLLYFHEKDIKSINSGDILVFNNYDYIVSHRVVDRGYHGFITKGDANKKNDPKEVDDNSILGIGTEWCIPFVGYYLDFIYNRKYIFILLIVMLIICLIIPEKKNEEI